METNKNPQKNPFFYCCIFCDYNTSSSKDYNKHVATPKHERLTNANKNPQKIPKNPQKNYFECKCGKIYKHMSSLCKHKKICYMPNTEIKLEEMDEENNKEYKENNKIDKITDMVLDVMKQNNELTKQLVEIASKSTISNSNNNINSHNKTFNLQFFLNEQCKDALNINDFISSIHLQLSDLEVTGRIGYVEGISKIVIKNLKELDTFKRPIHCSDLKREILYIKDENQWTKENEEKNKLQKIIKEIAKKNIGQIPIWTKENPNYKDPESKQNEKYMKIVGNAMSGGTTEEQEKNINQIIKNVAKEVLIDK